DRLQPRFVVHILDVVLHCARGPRDAHDPGGGSVGGDRGRRACAASRGGRPPWPRRARRSRDPRRTKPSAPGLPAGRSPRTYRASGRRTDMTVTVTPTGVTVADVLAVARGADRVEIAPETVAAMATSRGIIDDIERQGRPVYGVSTGLGALANTFIAPERRAELQHSLIRSHASGVGVPMPREVVRAMMLLRVRSLALGHSGVRPLVSHALV